MKITIHFVLAAIAVIGLCRAETKTEKNEGPRGKRGFLDVHPTGTQYGIPFTHGGAFSAEHGVFFPGTVSKSAAVAAASASFKRAKAAEIARAANAAQAAALGETSIASKTAAAVSAADKTSNIAVSLGHKIRDAFSESEALTEQAWKSLEAAKVVEAAQSAMVFKSQQKADFLSQRQFHTINALQAAQAAALRAKAAASIKRLNHLGAGKHGVY